MSCVITLKNPALMRFPHLLFNFLNVVFFLLFRNYAPFEKDGYLFWTSLNSLHHRMLCAKFVWNWLNCSGKEDLLNFVNLFRYFVIISSWERTGSFIRTNWNPLQPMMHCAKFGWNWLNGSREEDFYLLMYFCSPWKRIGPFIWTNSNLLHPRMHCSLFQWFWRRRWQREKFTPTTTTTADNGHILIRKTHLSLPSGELKIRENIINGETYFPPILTRASISWIYKKSCMTHKFHIHGNQHQCPVLFNILARLTSY